MISQSFLFIFVNVTSILKVSLNLRVENVLLDENDNVKLFGYGLGRMTNYGGWVSFPIGDPR